MKNDSAYAAGRTDSAAVSVCLHKKNADKLRETVNLLAELGVSSVKAGSMMQLG